jgi:hypothetical protein
MRSSAAAELPATNGMSRQRIAGMLASLHAGDIMSFQITGLRAKDFEPLFALADDELRAHLAVRVVADKKPGFPCRVSLQDAEVGEILLLINHEHLCVASPYRSRHAIYVRQGACDAHLEIDEIPPVLSTRLLSLRAFDSAGMLREADVMPGTELAGAITRMFISPTVAYLHVHNAKPGCFAARVDRA